MGGSSWSNSTYTSVESSRAASGRRFAYTEDIRQGTVEAAVHDLMNPFGATRESRDSEAHPNSVAIGILFDQTGSMGHVPPALQQRLGALMQMLIDRNILADPQILFGAIGDAIAGGGHERAPLQVGQFESGLEMDEDLERLYLEGGGGAGMEESYEMGMYFFARHTETDCWEKRSHKGYLFLLGDEKAYPRIHRGTVRRLIGDELEEDIPTADIVAELQRRYEVYFIVPPGTAHYTAPWLEESWTELLGEGHFVRLQDLDSICEMMATIIAGHEGALSRLGPVRAEVRAELAHRFDGWDAEAPADTPENDDNVDNE